MYTHCLSFHPLEPRCLLDASHAEQPQAYSWETWIEDLAQDNWPLTYVNDALGVSDFADFAETVAQAENPLSYAAPITAATLAGVASLWLAKKSLWEGGGYSVAFLRFAMLADLVGMEPIEEQFKHLASMTGLYSLCAYAETLAQQSVMAQATTMLGQTQTDLAAVSNGLKNIDLNSSIKDQLVSFAQQHMGTIIATGLQTLGLFSSISGISSSDGSSSSSITSSSSSSSISDSLTSEPSRLEFNSDQMNGLAEQILEHQKSVGAAHESVGKVVGTLNNPSGPKSFFYQMVQHKLPVSGVLKNALQGVAYGLDATLWLSYGWLHLKTVKHVVEATYRWTQKTIDTYGPIE